MLIRCSRCRSISIRKSKRRGVFEKTLSVLVRPYRCKGCYHRFFPLFQTILANARSSEDVEAGQVEGDHYYAKGQSVNVALSSNNLSPEHWSATK